ncbi:MAG: amino acid adenylation protein, partial [Planctomycetota bacterium]
LEHLVERMSALPQAPVASAPVHASPLPRRVVLVTMLQASLLAGELAVGSAALYVAVFELLPRLVRTMGLPPFLLFAPVGFALTRIALSTVAAFALAGNKRLCFARTLPGPLPAWSLAYFRAWLLAHWSAALPWSIVQGTELHSSLLRLLGAKIGKRVHMHRGVSFRRGAWDLLRIGDDVTLSQDAHLQLADLEDGHLIHGRIELGDRVTLDVRATVGPDSVLADGSYLSALSYAEPGSRLTADRAYSGHPAEEVGPAPEREDPELQALSSARYTAFHLGLHLASSTLAGLPAMLLLIALARASETSATEVVAWLNAPRTTAGAALLSGAALLFAAPLGLLFSALLIRALGEVRPGQVPRSSMSYLRIWWKSVLVERAGRWLSGSLFWPLWLRAAGCKIGRGSEISTIIDIVPERLSIGRSCFFADGIYLGGPRIHRGVVTVEDTVLGDHTFLGNHVVVPNGARLPEESFYGVCTVTHPSASEEGKEWFGHPPLRLPRRERREADRALTHEPGPLRFANRLLWESARFALPLLPAGLGVLWITLLASLALEQGLWMAPAITLCVGSLSCASLWATKWLLLGRVRPGEHALWSCWCSRWDFVYVAWLFWARGILARLEGTLILAPFLRAMGMKIGRRVVLGTGFAQVVDPDMLEFDDDCTVSGLFQAHSFEDRILKVDRVRIGREASVAHGALLFYDVELADKARLLPHAVAMKGERLKPRTYAGSPCAERAARPGKPLET